MWKTHAFPRKMIFPSFSTSILVYWGFTGEFPPVFGERSSEQTNVFDPVTSRCASPSGAPHPVMSLWQAPNRRIWNLDMMFFRFPKQNLDLPNDRTIEICAILCVGKKNNLDIAKPFHVSSRTSNDLWDLWRSKSSRPGGLTIFESYVNGLV